METIYVRLAHKGDPALTGYHMDTEGWNNTTIPVTASRLADAIATAENGHYHTVWVYFHTTRKKEATLLKELERDFKMQYGHDVTHDVNSLKGIKMKFVHGYTDPMELRRRARMQGRSL